MLWPVLNPLCSQHLIPLAKHFEVQSTSAACRDYPSRAWSWTVMWQTCPLSTRTFITMTMAAVTWILLEGGTAFVRPCVRFGCCGNLSFCSRWFKVCCYQRRRRVHRRRWFTPGCPYQPNQQHELCWKAVFCSLFEEIERYLRGKRKHFFSGELSAKL